VASAYYYNWRTDRKQDYKWNGSYGFSGMTIVPSYEYVLSEETGFLASKYSFYQSEITDPYLKVGKYFVIGRQITPRISFTYPQFWIFSPQMNYGNEYRMDYTNSYLDNHGKIDFSTAVNLNTLLSWLPNITRYSFSIDSTSHYEETQYPGSLNSFNQMPFESRWSAFLWKMLDDENEIRRFETSAKNGVFVILHSLSLDEIRLLGTAGFTPSASYSLNRTYYSQGAVRSFDEVISFSCNNIYINNVTIPIPYIQDFVTNQKMTGSYSYSRNINRDTDKVIKTDTITNNFSVLLPYDVKAGVKGNVSISGSRSDSTQGLYRTWSGYLTPSLSIDYKFTQTQPITFPSWLWLIGNKTFRFEQDLIFDLTLSVKYTMGGDNDKNATLIDSKESIISGTASYKILQNLTATLGLDYGHMDNSLKKELEYDKFGVSLGAVIEF
jgi:hypothetical protein